MLLYNKHFVLYINNPAFFLTYNYCCFYVCKVLQHVGSIYIAVTYTSCAVYLISFLATKLTVTSRYWDPFICIYSNELALLPSTSCRFPFFSAHHWLLAAHRAGSSQIEGREGILIGEQYPLVETQPINEAAINYLYA